MFLNTAENTYNELLYNIGKFECIELFLDECAYMYDATIYYIYDCIGLECNDERFRYLDNCITKELSWEEVYENIHEVE